MVHQGSTDTAMEPYAPLNALKPFTDNVWIVDGPEIRMDMGPFRVPFPTRMVIVRLKHDHLWVHSPIAPDPALFEAIETLGSVRYLIAPNSIHYWYMADWQERFPKAESFAVPGLKESAKRPFRVDHVLEDDARFEWEDEIDWLLVPGTVVSEAVFHIQASRVLVLTDLIENFEPRRVKNWFLRLLLRLAGATGSAPIDMRWTYRPKRRKVASQIAAMLGWHPQKVVMAHGKVIETDASTRLDQAFRWALKWE